MAFNTAKVDARTFYGVQWALAGIALCFLVFRFLIRIKSHNKLFSDDYLVIFAFIMLLANNILWHTQLQAVFDEVAIANGQLVPTNSVIANAKRLLRSILALNLLFNCCLWAVKFSFLFFFRRLGHRTRGYNIWWWCVLAITICAWAVSIGDFQFACSVNSIGYIMANCSTRKSAAIEARAFRTNTAMDLLTDILIITIPVLMLWNVRIPLHTKLALLSVFSLTTIVMVIALVRLLVIPAGTIAVDLTWSSTWSTIEMATSIIVACLGSFRQLYIMTNDKNKLIKLGEVRSSVLSWRIFSVFRSRTSSGRSAFTQRLFSFLRPKSKFSDNDTFRDEWSDSSRSLNKDSTRVGEPIAPMTKVYISH